jgi:pimeloyl-ACP methyl ester carboxylesterase
MFVDSPLKEQLMERHRQVGPMSQYRDLMAIDQFDVRDRIAGLKAPLLLIRGNDDPTSPPQYEEEIIEVVPSARLLRLDRAGHFPMVERPIEVNAAIEGLLRQIGG